MTKAELIQQIQVCKQLLAHTGSGMAEDAFTVKETMKKAELEALYQRLLQVAEAYSQRVIEVPVVEKTTLVMVDCENLNFQEIYPQLKGQKHIQLYAVIGAKQATKKFRYDDVLWLKVPFTEKNAVDFALVTQLTAILTGTVGKSYEKTIILSKDKGFDAAVGVLRGMGFDVQRAVAFDAIDHSVTLEDLDAKDLRQMVAEGMIYIKQVNFRCSGVRPVLNCADVIESADVEDAFEIEGIERCHVAGVQKLLLAAAHLCQEATKFHLSLSEELLLERLSAVRGGDNRYRELYQTYKPVLLELGALHLVDDVVTVKPHALRNQQEQTLPVKAAEPEEIAADLQQTEVL